MAKWELGLSGNGQLTKQEMGDVTHWCRYLAAVANGARSSDLSAIGNSVCDRVRSHCPVHLT